MIRTAWYLLYIKAAIARPKIIAIPNEGDFKNFLYINKNRAVKKSKGETTKLIASFELNGDYIIPKSKEYKNAETHLDFDRWKFWRKIYYLKSCSTNQRILKSLNLTSDVVLQNIKEENIDEKTLDFLKEKVGSYEALFSKKAMKYKSLGLKDKNLKEADFKALMLEEYTFLSRPFIINGDSVFIGNSKLFEVGCCIRSP